MSDETPAQAESKPSPQLPPRMMRSTNDRVAFGVCGGLAQQFEADSKKVRLIYMLATALTCFIPGVVAYLLLTLIVPVDEKS